MAWIMFSDQCPAGGSEDNDLGGEGKQEKIMDIKAETVDGNPAQPDGGPEGLVL